MEILITMQPEIINHPYLTAIKRTDLSVPTRYLLQHNLLKGRILDYGCGFGYDTDELIKRAIILLATIIIIVPTILKVSSIQLSATMS